MGINTGIAEETAQELNNAFECFIKSSEAFESVFEAKMEVIVTNIVKEQTAIFLGYVEKYCGATFLTRWYWLRKMHKSSEALMCIVELKDELFKATNHDEERTS